MAWRDASHSREPCMALRHRQVVHRRGRVAGSNKAQPTGWPVGTLHKTRRYSQTNTQRACHADTRQALWAMCVLRSRFTTEYAARRDAVPPTKTSTRMTRALVQSGRFSCMAVRSVEGETKVRQRRRREKHQASVHSYHTAHADLRQDNRR